MFELRSVYIENWGPLSRARIDIAGLTAIIGPQNSGKTYLATLIHLLYGDLSWIIKDTIIMASVDLLHEEGYRGYISPEKVIDYIEQNTENLKQRIYHILGSRINHLVNQMNEYFLVDKISDLIRKGANEVLISAKYCIIEDNKCMHTNFVIRDDKISIVNLDIQDEVIRNIVAKASPEVFIYEKGWSITFRGHLLRPSVLYIPVERLLVIPAFHNYISLLLIVQRTWHMYRRHKEFLERIGIRLKATLIEYFNTIGRALEKPVKEKVLDQGYYYVEGGSIWYIDKHSVRIPISLASSGIAQIIGIQLPLTAIKKPNLIIIEEPEVNLHPNMQIRIAEYIAQLSRKSKVLITTHSHYLLAKLAHLYAKNQIGEFKSYFINPDIGEVKELYIDRETGEIEVPETISEVLSSLADEAIEILRKTMHIDEL